MPNRYSQPDSNPSRPAKKVSFDPHATVLTCPDLEQQLAHADSALAEATARLNWLLEERSRVDALQSNSRQHLRDMDDYVLSTDRDVHSARTTLIQLMESTEDGWGVRSPEADRWVAILNWHFANHTHACTRLRIATESDQELRAEAQSFSDQIIDQALQQAMDAATAVNALENQIGHAQGILSQENTAPPATQRVYDMDDLSIPDMLLSSDDESDPWFPEPDPPVFLWRIDPTLEAGGEMRLWQPSHPMPIPYSMAEQSELQPPCEMDWAGAHAGHYSAF